MDLFKCFLLLYNFIVRNSEVESACNLSLNKDFGNPSPVYLQSGRYLSPNVTSGDIYLKRSQTVLVACPGDRRHIVLGNSSTHSNVLEAHCIVDNAFRVDRWIGEFRDIKCNIQPWFTTEESGQICHRRSKMIKVGYRVKGKLLELYEACFDKNEFNTHFVVHQLAPGAKNPQLGGRRPQFVEGNLFGKVKMAELYKIETQRKRLDAILGRGMAEKYLSKNQFLTRGHLAARADFSLRAEQRASFHYVNTAPQWMRGNAGDWAALEEALRRRVDTNSLVVFTGTHGVLQLLDSSGKYKDIYLDADENNNPLVPVPRYFYKLIYDPDHKTAAAFVSINSSFYNRTTVAQLSFCNEDCSRHRWLKWRDGDGTHSFCCDYEEFVNTVDYLPELDVRGVFY